MDFLLWVEEYKVCLSGGEARYLERRSKMEHLTEDNIATLREFAERAFDGKPVIIINVETGEAVSGGMIVDEKKARATPCHGYDIGEGKRMLWSKGVIGTLNLPEQKRFCKKGIDIKPMTGRLKKRITALRKAGITFR